MKSPFSVMIFCHFFKTEMAIHGVGVEFENFPIVPIYVSNRDYWSDPFSPGSWHEPVLKVPFSNSTPPLDRLFIFEKIKIK